MMGVMVGPRAVWVLFLPFAAAGWIGAHAAAYMIVAPHDGHRSRLLAESGHGYLGAVPVVLACAITLAVAGLVLAILEGLRGGSRVHVPVWPLVVVPPLGFAVQEHLERLIELGAFPLGAALEPTFVVGVALQLPLAIAALVLARALLALGHLIGLRLAARRSARRPAPPRSSRVPAWTRPRLLRPLATGHGQRAPPAPGAS
jgi:hypothetical protein